MNAYQLLNLQNGHGPRDLREYLPTAGKIYPVDPDAVERFKRITAEREAEARAIHRQAHEQKRKRPFQPQKEVNKPMIDTNLYSPHVVKAAKTEMQKKPSGRRFKKVFTAEVAAVWRDLLAQGKTVNWLAEFNGLAPVTPSTIQSVLDRYPATQPPHPNGKAAADTRPVPKQKQQPAPADPPVTVAPATNVIPAPADEDTQPIFTPDMLPAFLRRDYLPPVQARPAAGIDTLVELLRDEHVQIEGEIQLNLTIRVNK